MIREVRSLGSLLIRRYAVADAGDTWQVFRAAVHGTAGRDYTPEQIEAWAPPTVDASRLAEIRGQKLKNFDMSIAL
jgi:putative acetyltransferase